MAPTRLKRDLRAERPHAKGGTDSTGVWTRQGWLELGVGLEGCSRQVLGWARAASGEEDLVIAALPLALAQRRRQAGRPHHWDRGSQDTSKADQAFLSVWGLEVSMSRKGDCCANALRERCFAPVKGAGTDRQHWASHSQARQAIFEYVEVFYTRQRRPGSLD